MKYDKFTREQIIYLTFASGSSNMAFNFTWAIYLAGRTGWIALIVGILLTIPFIIAILYLSKKYPGYNIFEIINIGFGKPVYIIIVIVNAIINIALGMTELNFLTEMVKTYFLQMTPVWVIMLVIIIMAFLFLNNKILLLGRVIELLTVWCILNYFTGFSFGIIKEIDFKNIFPIFDTTLLKFGEAVFFSLASASEIILFVLVMIEHMPQTDANRKSIIKGIGLWALILSLAAVIMQGIVGVEIVEKISSVGVEVSRVIYFGDFIRGLELFILATYQLICTMKVTLYLYCTWIPIKKMFKEKHSIILLILMSIILLVSSVKLNSYNKAFFVSIFLDYYILLPFVVIVLVIAFIGTHIHRMKKNNGSDIR